MAKLGLLLVEPEVRRTEPGGRLVAGCVSFARGPIGQNWEPKL